jgi:pimeloyl-ACP methyl ester carboxylesterase
VLRTSEPSGQRAGAGTPVTLRGLKTPSFPFCLEAEVKRSLAFWSKIALPVVVAAAAGIAVPAVSAHAGPAPAPAAASAWSSCSLNPSPPAGFTEAKVRVDGVGINYVRGGHGPTLLLLHGYPESWYEWDDILPALARHYTVVAPDLPGAGLSDAPATQADYTKKAMAADIYGLMVKLGLSHHVSIVGHDIGTMVAYSYAAAHPKDVAKLALSEILIPDSSLYTLPALNSAKGPGVWWFGLFNEPGTLAYDLLTGKEKVFVTEFIPLLEVVKNAITPCDLALYAHYLELPGHLQATIDWFSTFPQDVKNDAVYQKTKLTMPVLAIGGSATLGSAVAAQARNYAANVTGVVIPDTGHWLYEERPAEMTRLLLQFLK